MSVIINLLQLHIAVPQSPYFANLDFFEYICIVDGLSYASLI